ncbi:MAG: hypothetical protein HYT12_03365 [Candidatus Liptonbacteria bacterium]|nr:hypothetical protein [Candidatus Liptonbacteria bacterium]
MAKNLVLSLVFVILSSLIGCAGHGGSGGDGGGGDGDGGSRFQYDDSALYAVDVPDYGTVSAILYIIGACNTTDDPDTNVTSFGYPGNVLGSPSGWCPGAPYKLVFTPVPGAPNMLDLDVEVGPLPAPYKFLSVPWQLNLDPNDVWAMPGKTGRYGPNLREWLFPAADWASVTHQGVTFRRNFVGYDKVSFIANPTPLNLAETVEPRWTNLPRGAILTAHERLEVVP